MWRKVACDLSIFLLYFAEYTVDGSTLQHGPYKLETMTRGELIKKLRTEYPNIPTYRIYQSVSIMFEEIATALHNGRRADIRGLGVFETQYYSERYGSHPRSGETFRISSKRRVRFRASKPIRKLINDHYKLDENT